MALVDICSIFDNSNWVTVGLLRIMFMIFSLLFSLFFSLSSFSAERVISSVLFGTFSEMADYGKTNSTIVVIAQ